MKTRFVAAASLLAVCIAAASGTALAQPGAPQAAQLRQQLAGFADERTVLLSRIRAAELRIASLRGSGNAEQLKAAWGERTRLRAELRALDASIRVVTALYKNGGSAGASSLEVAQRDLERKVVQTANALRLAREELASARAGHSDLSVAQASQAVQFAARQHRTAKLTVAAFDGNREEIDAAVTVAQSARGTSGLPKKSSTGSTDTAAPGKGRRTDSTVSEPVAVAGDPVQTTEPVTDTVTTTDTGSATEPATTTGSVLETLQAIAADEPATTSEPVVATTTDPGLQQTAGQDGAVAVLDPAPTTEPEPVIAAAPQTTSSPEPESTSGSSAEPLVAPAPETVVQTEPVATSEPEAIAQPVAAVEPEAAPAPVPEAESSGTTVPPEPVIADTGTGTTPPAEEQPALPEEPVLSDSEIDDMLAAAPTAPPAEEPVAEPVQPPASDEPVAVVEPEPVAQQPEPALPPPDAEPIAVVEPDPVVQDPAPADEPVPPPADDPVAVVEEPAPLPQEPAAPVTGSAVLSWTTPVTRANGSPLSMAELHGYEIYVVAESTGESTVIEVSDPYAVNYTVDQLPPDTYHFAISAVDTDQHVSDMSPIVSKTIADTTVASAP